MSLPPRKDDRLTPEQRRKIVALQDQHGLSFKQIGQRFGISSAQAHVIYHQSKAVTPR